MTHVSMQPKLEALRLEYAAVLFDSAANQLAWMGQRPRTFDVSQEDADRLLAAAELVCWLAQRVRRFAVEVRAIDQMNAATWRDEPAVPDDASVFELPLEPPTAPTAPEKLASMDFQSLDSVRERFQEAQDVLRYGGSRTARSAAGLAGRFYRWCGG
ncbi:hypothetical protein [Mycobacterium shimoidei]|uniref:hypothetical protein n=1 Tax=Mycobacterium shimoidei TaxID=29313 RepID=UPI0008491537|nr:hypothetical protein [Mycobacterium shimoidei]MCV7258380.1 hypothetical protein [Mycobacterium shimoidei]ODR06192.1 hypothetical protein BHQ16_21890 [Mycobacterium shimoidei]ORW77949.1 hypothetical protein AWC26_18615 [Mycobacterium shimoidei]